jgi:hypothetical protein
MQGRTRRSAEDPAHAVAPGQVGAPHRRQLVAEARRLERLKSKRRQLARQLRELDGKIRDAERTIRDMVADPGEDTP